MKIKIFLLTLLFFNTSFANEKSVIVLMYHRFEDQRYPSTSISVKNFHEQIKLTGLIITKLDGSAKGGVIVSLAEQFKLPIFAVGVGEKVDDLDMFKADDYSKALLNLE